MNLMNETTYIRDIKELIPSTSQSFPFLIYRGQTKNDPLIPSVFRHKYESVKDIEKEIYTDFYNLIQNHETSKNLKNAWEFLCYAQHIGAPTRLLDWTINPLIAAYFAVEDAYNDPQSNGVIFKLNVTKHYKDYDQNKDENQKIEHNRIGFRGVNIVDLPKDRYFLRHLIRDNDNKSVSMTGVHIIQPPVIDARIQSQSALFTVDLDDDAYAQDEKLGENITKYIIHAENKHIIKTQLYRMGIHAGSIYPDVNGIGLYLRDRRDRENWVKKDKSKDMTDV